MKVLDEVGTALSFRWIAENNAGGKRNSGNEKKKHKRSLRQLAT